MLVGLIDVAVVVAIVASLVYTLKVHAAKVKAQAEKDKAHGGHISIMHMSRLAGTATAVLEFEKDLESNIGTGLETVTDADEVEEKELEEATAATALTTTSSYASGAEDNADGRASRAIQDERHHEETIHDYLTQRKESVHNAISERRAKRSAANREGAP